MKTVLSLVLLLLLTSVLVQAKETEGSGERRGAGRSERVQSKPGEGTKPQGSLKKTASKPKSKSSPGYTGYYTLRYSNVNNSLQVLQLPDGKIKFDLLALLMTGDSPRNGEVRGTVAVKDGVAVYAVDGCKVKFKFEKNKVNVAVNNVDACAFGAYVTADGTYTRRDSKTPKFDF